MALQYSDKNRVISTRRTFQGAWAVTVETPHNTFEEFQYFGYTKKEALALARVERRK